MSEPKKYELNVGDLLQIPEESFDNFLIDLKKWHKTVRNTMDMLETIADAIGEEKPGVNPKLIWIDDGKHEGRIIIKSPKDLQEDK